MQFCFKKVEMRVRHIVFGLLLALLALPTWAQIMSEEKANQKERLRIPVDRVKQFFPKSYTTARMEEEIIKLCEAQYRRRMSREAR